MSQRNRSEGWKHAKNSGHENEELIECLLSQDKNNYSLKKISNSTIKYVSIGGIKEKGVEGILGRKTKSKTDLKITWSDDLKTNISIKKSIGGQVFLIGTESFLQGFKNHYNKTIPPNVVLALKLFFGEGETAVKLLSGQPILDIEIRRYENSKKRFVWKTLSNYNEKLADDLLEWFKENIGLITNFCFSKGLASDPQEWAGFIWYKDLVDGGGIDQCIEIDELCAACDLAKKSIKPGTRGGGTTILLPFGFVQWHQGKMQFHHSLEAIRQLGALLRM